MGIGGMNYILQINAFWERLTTNPLKQSSISLYFFLLYRNNLHGWKKEFTVDYEIAINMIGVSKNTYYSSLDELVKNGYVTYQKSFNRSLCGIISINVLYQKLGIQKELKGNRTGLDLGVEGEQDCDSIGNLDKPLKEETLKEETLKHIDEDCKIVIEELLKYFGFNEIANPDKHQILAAFTFVLKNKGRLEYFQNQFENYRKYKEISGEIKHNFNSFLGKQAEGFEGGAWEGANWELKLKDHLKKGEKISFQSMSKSEHVLNVHELLQQKRRLRETTDQQNKMNRA